MPKTSLKQKLFLIIFGVLLTIIFLEISLRIAGLFVLYLQEQHNHLSFNKNEYRILCLGESTTALGGEDSYPSQLEQLLNTQSPQIKFTVINEGIISTTTDYILNHLDQNLDKYKPQLVIVMMGINDKAYLHNPNKTLWWEHVKSFLKDFRIYKLSHLIYEHLTHRIKGINAPQEPNDLTQASIDNYQQVEDFLKRIISIGLERFSEHMSAVIQYQKNQQFTQAQEENKLAQASARATSLACVQLAQRYRIHGSYQEALNIMKKATILNPKETQVYQEWGEDYLAIGKNAEASKAFEAALTLDPHNSNALKGLAHAYYQGHDDNAFIAYAGYLQIKPQDYWAYIELSEWLITNKHYDQAEAYLGHAIEFQPDFDDAYLDFAEALDDQGQYKQEKEFYLRAISLHPKSMRLYKGAGQFYQRQGRGDLAKEYFQKAAEQQMAEYYPVTLVNYSLLIDKILSRHIKVIVMQYPLRDIAALKDYLGQRNGVIFVENMQDFKEALTKEGFNYYFKDNFAYNFGHCTRAGNSLIAHHLADIILKND